MRTLITSILIVSTSLAFAQNWFTLHKDNYIPFDQSQLTGFVSGYAKTSFKTNPYDTSVWLVNKGKVMRFDKNGQFDFFDNSDHSNFDNLSVLRAITFTPNYTYVASPYYGIFRYDNISWVLASGVNGCVHLSADEDTIWMSRVGGTPAPSYFFQLSPVANTFGTKVYEEFYARNGIYWGSTGTLSMYTNQSAVFLNADTIDYLLESQNRCFNFSTNDNQFYVGGNKGISVAYNHQFIDTITPYNTVGMPLLPIIEIEFDSQDNLWVVFGEDDPNIDDPTKIGYLDRSSNSWTIYDATNSPFTDQFKAIEVDACDNLWVLENSTISILTSGNCSEDWLSVNELDSQSISLYPNPSRGEFLITDLKNVANIKVHDLLGRKVGFELINGSLIIHENGIFLVRLRTHGGLEILQKVIVE